MSQPANRARPIVARMLAVATASDREAFDGQVARGSDALRGGRLDDATSAFQAALAIEPGSSRVLALLGLTHFRANHLELARPIYEDLVERLPTDASHRLNLGLVYLKLGDADRAITSLEASRALDPSQGRAVSYLGLAYARAGRYAEAYRSFLIAGQMELAREIEQNLTRAERDGIHAQLAVSSPGIAIPAAAPAPAAPAAPPPAAVAPSPAQPASGPIVAPGGRNQPRTTPPPPPGPRVRPSEPPRSMPAIVVDRPPVDVGPSLAGAPSNGEVDASETDFSDVPAPRGIAARAADAAAADRAAAPAAPMRFTESMQFVIGRGEIKPAHDISEAVAAATPAPAHLGGAIPLSQLATTDLVHVDDGDTHAAFELAGDGALVIRVTERVVTRLDRIHVVGGELAFEPATRRSRGHHTDEHLDYGGSAMHVAQGRGYLIALAEPDGAREFVAVTLDDDILYLREDLVFAFEASLRWETGHVPGLRGQLPVVQFRGDGSLVLRLAEPLVKVKLPPQGVLHVEVSRIAGWIGRVIPRAVVPPAGSPLGDLCVECTGEGIVLVDRAGAPSRPSLAPAVEPVTDAPTEPRSSRPDIVELRAPSRTEAEQSVADLMSDLVDDDDPHRDEI
jgi:Flp pilus assembly protein TadD